MNFIRQFWLSIRLSQAQADERGARAALIDLARETADAQMVLVQSQRRQVYLRNQINAAACSRFTKPSRG
jgi:hypothetical protein